MAEQSMKKTDLPALLAMIEQNKPKNPADAAMPQTAQVQAAAPVNEDPSPYASMMAMTGAPPPISAEEKALQAELLKGVQNQNVRLESDIGGQRTLENARREMAMNPTRDITPAIQNLFNIAGQNGTAAVAAAKPDSPDQLTDKLQSAIKETAGSQDKLSDNQLNLLKMRLQFANQKGTAGAASKQAQMVANYYQKLAKDTNPSMASGRNGMGNPYKGLLGVDKVQGVLDSADDLNQLTPQQVQDVYEGVAGIVSNGNGTSEARLNSLIPANARKSIANFQQYITSIPVGAQQKEFLENVQHLVDRERHVLTQNVRQSQKDSFQGMAPFFATDPKGQQLYQQLLSARGFRPDLSYDPEASMTGYTKRKRETVETAPPGGGSGTKPAMTFEQFKALKAQNKLP